MQPAPQMDYGPLSQLIGTWRGQPGMDHAPEPHGHEDTPYADNIVYEAIGEVVNAEQQQLAALRYHQVVTRLSNNEVFHNETGYLTWDANTQTATQTLTIPRGVAVVASGTATTDEDGWTHIDLSAEQIAQSAFMAANAETTGFTHRISVRGDELRYSENTQLNIYGGDFAHTDENVLTRQPS